MNLCDACYTRYSTDRQSPLSTEDQLRKCREFAVRQGWQISKQHIYSDQASSGAGVDRPALNRLLKTALSSPPPFQVILLDDTSRLSRSLSDALRIIERLNFAGVRVVAVSQGIDSQDQQAEVLVAVHGLVDSLYIKELAQKTHRWLEGKALRGLRAGGRCYGYSSEQTDDGVAFKVNNSEAAVDRRIFQMSAEGQALKTIAKALNAENIQSPRPRKGRPAAGWCPTGIREMLHNERYTCRIFWNRSRFVKVPGINRRVRRPRPPEEWCIVDAEHLRIIPDALWRKVHERLSWLKETYAQGRPSGLLSRSATSRYLFSGFFVCASCGGTLTIVSGSGKRNLPRYGCPRHFDRGTCTNNLTERQDRLESRLPEGLQRAVLQPEVVDYVLSQFERELG
jgi:site-specific DNA recombinase